MIEYRSAVNPAVEANGGLNGMVTPFGVETVIGDLKRGGFRESIQPGAFSKTLQERDVVFLFNHDTSKPLARTSVLDGEGSLTLAEDSKAGLMATARPVQTSYGQDLMLLTRSKVVKGMSFGFEVIKDSWADDNGNPSDSQRGTRRTIQEVRLHEVSAVTFPAYPTTTLAARDAVVAARGITEERAPKATYADVETCGECGATGQYGAYCGSCGGSMSSSKPSSAYCTSCGGKIPGERSEHQCAEIRKDAKPYGDVEYADPKNGKYPVDSKEHAKAAWAYINMPKNAGEYPLNGVSLESVKDKIKAALKKFGVQVSEENAAALAIEFRAEMAETDHGQGIASIDATLDQAKDIASKLDRNSLPAEVNQIIDLVNAAGNQIDDLMEKAGIPDPDEPSNSNEYSEAGSATSDDGERADMALFAEYIRISAEI